MAAAEHPTRVVLARLSVLKPLVITLFIALAIWGFVWAKFLEDFPRSLLADWKDTLCLAGACVLVASGVWQIRSAFAQNFVGVFVEGDRLEWPHGWRQGLPLQQIVSVVGKPYNLFWRDLGRIEIGLADGSVVWIFTSPFSTPCAEVVAAIKAHAPFLAAARHGENQTRRGSATDRAGSSDG